MRDWGQPSLYHTPLQANNLNVFIHWGGLMENHVCSPLNLYSNGLDIFWNVFLDARVGSMLATPM